VSAPYQLAGWFPVIGLEVHCQLKTNTKMFSACAMRIGESPNTQTDAYTWGLPGTLPVPNRRAVDDAIRLALATGCEIHPVSRFARKHYFYPDLPKGYQITQSDHPYATGGRIEIPLESGDAREVRLIRIHMEEDAGKNTHLPGTDLSLVDYNRAGAPLLEIVSEPDVRSPREAGDYMKQLRTIIRYLGISDANMEEGTLRCDANVSLRRSEDAPYGTRCEIKNLNSFKFLEEALEAEIRRQVDILDGGGEVVQCTLSYDTGRRETRVMRTKEEAADYRYFPEPDLPPLVIDDAWVSAVRESLPELPGARRRRYREMGLSEYDAGVLTADVDLASFFDAVIDTGAPAKPACNWLTTQLLGRLNADDTAIADSPVSPARMAALVQLVEDGTISGRAAKDVFEKVYIEDLDPAAIVERDGLRQVSDTGVIEAAVQAVIDASPRQVEQYRQGKTKVRGYFVGQVMKRTRGQANPGVVNELLDRLLPEPEGDV
jgi:aspartyl-tRNA(Asn)/glutamyl-tRNA(Gln) amidotransferase subunit B